MPRQSDMSDDRSERRNEKTKKPKEAGEDGRKSSGDESKEVKDGERSGSSGSKKLSSPSSSRSVAAFREQEFDKLVRETWTSHAGWLCPILNCLSKTFNFPPLLATLLVGLTYLFLLLASPPSLQPHVSAPLTLLIPLINTLRAARIELEFSPGKSHDSPQWCVYWIGYMVISCIGGLVEVYRPGWTWAYAVARGVGLVVLGGGWFGRAALRWKPSAKVEEREKEVKGEKELVKNEQEKEMTKTKVKKHET